VQACYNLGRVYHEAAFRARRQSEREQAARDAGVYQYEDSHNRKEEEEDHARKGEKIDSRPLLQNGEHKKKGDKKGKHTEAGSNYLQKAETMYLEQAESEAARDASQVSVFVLLY